MSLKNIEKITIRYLGIFIGLFLFDCIISVYEEANQKFLDTLPSFARNVYLRQVFNLDSQSILLDTYTHRATVLQSLERDLLERNNSYHFEYNLLLPLIKRGQEELAEPIPQAAAYLLLQANDATIFSRLFHMYASDTLTLEAFSAKWRQLHGLHPERARVIAGTLQTVPNIPRDFFTLGMPLYTQPGGRPLGQPHTPVPAVVPRPPHITGSSLNVGHARGITDRVG